MVGMTTAFTILPIPGDVLEGLRHGTGDDRGLPVEEVVAAGGEPLRCCLRDAEPGEEILLFGYRPPLPAESPYCEQGAVFTHAVRCAGPDDAGYPPDWSSRPQVLRAYTADGRIRPASRTHDGTDPVRALSELLATDGVVEVHSRNIVYGCFMFAARAVNERPR
jgi:hypothetical protein